MQLKPFYQEEEGEDEELHPQEAGETRPAGKIKSEQIMEEEVIVISDEEVAEPPPEAYVEDCESSAAEQEGADSDATEPRPGSSGDHEERDPRRRRPHYGERRREEQPRQYRHTFYRGAVNTVETYDGLLVYTTLKYRTLYIEVPHARNPPSYVEEPPSPPSFPALPDAGAHSEPEALRVEHTAPLPEEAWRGEHRVPSPSERVEVEERVPEETLNEPYSTFVDVEEPLSPPSFPALPDAGAHSAPEASQVEHTVPLPEEAWRGERTVPSPAGHAEVEEWAPEYEEMPDEPHSTVGDESVRVGRPPADEDWWLEHPIPSPARSVTEEGEPVPWIEETRSPKASPKHTQRRRVDRPDPSATTRSATGAGLRSGSGGGTPRLWQLSGHGELEVDPTSVFPRISIRFKPGVVTNTRSTRPENAEPGDPPSLLRKRLRSRGRAQRSRSRRKRAKVAPLETAVPLAAAGQIVANEADHPAAKPGPVREAQAAEERPPCMSPSSAPDEPQEAAASPTESELLREMDDLLEGWEPELDEMLGEVAATLEPLIPRGWRVFPRGTILSAPTIQLLQAEVNRLGGEYHRSRFRVVDGEVLYTVTINAAGAVTVALCEKGGV
ncbi:hypothetical protein ACLKA6_016848 [Drosophila palustris]